MKEVSHRYTRFFVCLVLIVFTVSLFFNCEISKAIALISAPSNTLESTMIPPASSFHINTYSPDNSYTYLASMEQSVPIIAKKILPANVEKSVVASGTSYATDLYVIRSNKPGPTVMIVGGVHGNEPAGYRAANIIKDYKITKGTLLVLPEANKLAVDQGVRYISGNKDLNRCFPQSKTESADTILSRAIYDIVKNYNVDWLMDMHEGYNYSKLKNSSSVGQSLIYYPTASTKDMAKKIIYNLNKDISTSYKNFDLLTYPTRGSLSRATGQYLGVKSFIFETCTKQTLSTRVNYQLKAANTLLSSLGMR